MSQSKRELATIHLRHIRLELKELHMTLDKENLLPEPVEINALISQLEALLQVSDGTKKKTVNSFSD